MSPDLGGLGGWAIERESIGHGHQLAAVAAQLLHEFLVEAKLSELTSIDEDAADERFCVGCGNVTTLGQAIRKR